VHSNIKRLILISFLLSVSYILNSIFLAENTVFVLPTRVSRSLLICLPPHYLASLLPRTGPISERIRFIVFCELFICDELLSSF
jgi:hypothetical protein